jgi:predicted tellurium resistance membrane protein TerC
MGSNGLLLRIIKLFFRVSEDVPRGQFFAKDETGAWCATPLFVALLVVEGSDIIFAADSIPAIFGKLDLVLVLDIAELCPTRHPACIPYAWYGMLTGC